jgi:2-polyprenyl-3-methyl-5-hydroxy-6-metoxy-1,4-benzoquinol methylase
VKGSKGELPAGAPPACPGCKGRDQRLVGRKGSLVLWECRACTLVFTHPQPTMQVERKYLEEYDLATHFAAVAPRKRVLFSRRLKLLAEQRRGLGSRLCDVGCAGGQFLELARGDGWEAFGIEMNPPAAKRARETGAIVFEGALEQLDSLPWGTFDAVTCWDVLEHTPSPRLFVEKLSHLLAPEGVLVVTTLNWNAIVRRSLGMRWSMIVEDHFTYWTDHALRRLMEREDLQCLASETFGLGRDLVWPIDRVAATIRSARRHGNSAGNVRWPDQIWDTHPAVLGVETAANIVLRAIGAGVGLLATFARRVDHAK